MARLLSFRGLAQFVVLAVPLVVGTLMAQRAVDVPFWDEWEWTDLIYKMHLGTLQFGDLWTQHGEHRILVTNLIILGLARLGGWDPVREQFVSLGILVLSQIAIIAMLRKPLASTVGGIAAIAASLVLYGVWQWENLGWGFQLGWFICNACAITVAWLLARPGRRPVHVFLAAAAAVVASFTLSQGLIIWVVGIVAILLVGRRRGMTLAVWLPAAIVTYLIYRHGMFKVDAGHFDVLAHPVTALRYVLAYLGAPLGRWLGARGSTVAGVILVAALAAAFVADWRSPWRGRRFARTAAWYALAVFPLCCAVATCTGRAGYGIDQALASRYTSVGGLGWIALIGLAADYASRLEWSWPNRRFEAILIAATAFGFVIGANDNAASGEWKATALTLASARAELAQNDPAALPKIYPDRGRVVMLIGEMRSVHDGLFAGQ